MKSGRLLPVLLIGLAALLVVGCGTPPVVPGVPKGPAQWLRNVATACTTSTTDASGAQVSYQFDWGDGARSQWSQFTDGGAPFTDTHSFSDLGTFAVRVRAKNTKRASGWSPPLNVLVVPGEGAVAWSLGYTDPEDITDSSDFTLNSFAIGPDNTAYIACDYGAVIACSPSGTAAWRYSLTEFDQFTAAPLLADDGTILIGCSNDTVYALNANGTRKWADSVHGQVYATGALGADGTAFFQTADSVVVALRPDGSKLWESFTEGGTTAPVVGPDGTVYAINQNGVVYGLDPANGSQKWTPVNLLAASVQPPAIDPNRNMMYIVTENGWLQTFDLTSHTPRWSDSVGLDASGPVVGPDGSIYVSGGARLTKFSPDGERSWAFVPPLPWGGVLSTPALTADGYVYVLAVLGMKRRLAMQEADTLYATNPDGTRRWACSLGEGLSDPDYPLSAPKVGANGFIYVGDGFRAWCVAGVSAPAQTVWPMIYRDTRNTGRAQ